MTEVIRSDGIEIKKKVIQQILLRGSGDSKFNNHINKSLKLLPPSDNLRIISNDNYTLAKMSFDQWNLIFEKEIEIKKLNKILDDLNKLTHFDFREKSFKKSTAAQTLLARVDCSIFNLDLKLLLSCNRSFADYLEDRLIDAVNY